MDDKFSTPNSSHDTSSDLDDILAAEGQRGHEEHLKGPSIPQLKRAGLDEISPGSDWFVPGAVDGCWIIGAGAHAEILDERFIGTPYYWRWLFDERKPVFGGKKKTELVNTWSCEPRDAAYPKGLGYSRTSNGNLLSERVVIDLIHHGADGPRPCRLTLFGKDNRRIAETFRQRLLAKRIQGADGQMKPAPLYAMRIAITTETHMEVRKNSEVEVWEPAFEFLGVYPNADGPDRATIMLGRELCIGQEAIKYPDPNAAGVAPALRVVGSDTSSWSNNDDGPLPPHPDDPGATPYDEPIPF